MARVNIKDASRHRYDDRETRDVCAPGGAAAMSNKRHVVSRQAITLMWRKTRA